MLYMYRYEIFVMKIMCTTHFPASIHTKHWTKHINLTKSWFHITCGAARTCYIYYFLLILLLKIRFRFFFFFSCKRKNLFSLTHGGISNKCLFIFNHSIHSQFLTILGSDYSNSRLFCTNHCRHLLHYCHLCIT